MVGIGKLKIRKKVYKFDVRRRHYSEQHYKVKKKEPLDAIRESIRNFISPKKKEKKKRYVRKKVAEKKPAFNVPLAALAIFVALIVLLGGWFYISLQDLGTPAEFKPPTDKPKISDEIAGGKVLTAGDIGTSDYIAGVLVKYDTENIGNYTVSLETYETELPSEVFVLQSARDQADTYSSFMYHLRNNLSKINILVNEITMRELETLPQGAVVLVPSGAIPKEILGINSTLNPNNIADRGIVIIYIGHPFTKMHPGYGLPVETTPSDVLKTIPFTFDEGASIISIDDFSLYQPLYRVNSGSWSSSLAYGSVSILTRGNGAFIFIPQTLDGGWREDPAVEGKTEAEYAAEDIARIIIENPWAVPDGGAAVYKLSFTGEEAEKYTDERYFYTNQFEGEERSVKMLFSGISSVDPDLVVEDLEITRVKKEPNGDLYINGGIVVVSTNITNEDVRMFAKLDEPVAAQPNMYLVISDVDRNEVSRFPQGRVNVQADLSIDVPLYLSRGEYDVALMDDESKIYAQSYMRVVTVDITSAGTYDRNSNYRFYLEREGESIELSSVTVVVDEGDYGEYEFTNVEGVVYVDVGGYTGGDSLPGGEHIFTFIIGGLREDVIVEIKRGAPPLFTNPILWITLLLSVGIAGAGVFFARREQIFYAVDVPDFPPVAKIKIALSPDTVLSVFERVNESYRWCNTPLTIREIKNGFKDIFYKGKPIYITDYNAEYILDSLIGTGRVIQSLGYYGPLSWEKKTGKSMTYLAMMRKLRDICVNNATPFTLMGESKDADSEITVVGQQMFLHFYEKSCEADEKKLASLLKRALSTIDNGITIILFKNGIKKRSFIAFLESPSKAQLLLKLEVENRSVLLLTMNELEKMIKELKNV